MGNQAKPCEATGTFWVMRCYVESLAIYPVAAHRSTDYEHLAQGRRRFRHPDGSPCKPQAGERLYRWPAPWRSGAG